MATGFLWTEQYEECKSVLEKGKNQSMELDEKTLDGHWSTNSKTGMDFFIINDAIFSKLCILGDDVEPCFEGARVTAPEVSTSFSKVDDTFKKTLYTMMQELKFALEGGQSNMDLDNNKEVVDNEVVDNATTEETTDTQETNVEENDKTEQSISTENQQSIEAQSNESSFAKNEDDNKENSSDNDSEDTEKNNEENDKTKNACGEKEDEKTKHSLETELEELQNKYSKLEEDYNALVEFKNQIENEKKDALINSFYMLTDEDKADVIENKAKYSLDDIEAKLSVICVRKKVNFDLDEDEASKDENNNVDTNVMTYTLVDEESSTPAWISALKKTQSNRKEN